MFNCWFQPANGQVSASMSSAAQPSTSQTPVTNLKEPAASKKFEIKWTKKDFAPSDVECDYNPETAASAPEQPLVYFSKYFTEDLFQDFAEFTNRYVLQRDGTVLATTKEEISVFRDSHGNGCSEVPPRQNVLAS